MDKAGEFKVQVVWFHFTLVQPSTTQSLTIRNSQSQCWKDDSAVKSIYCSCRGSSTQNGHHSQPPVTPSSEDPGPLLAPLDTVLTSINLHICIHKYT